MAYGLQVEGFNFTYGSFSILQTGVVSGSSLYLYASNYPDITQFRVTFVPTGVRSTYDREVRPYVLYYSSLAAIINPSNASPHRYILFGR
jgi:hypothetical protein